MKIASKKLAGFAVFVICLSIILLGCQTSPHQKTASAIAQNSPANATNRLGDFIQSLHPVQVYQDGGNTVVVLQLTNEVESGKYLIPKTSTFLPISEEGGFTFEPKSKAFEARANAFIYDYHRNKTGAQTNNPGEHWNHFLKSLHAIQVYDDAGNTVVVQKIVTGVEYGKYLMTPLSNHVPAAKDGFVLDSGPSPDFTNQDGYVGTMFNYHKTPTAPRNSTSPESGGHK